MLLVLEFADGSVLERSADLQRGPLRVGGLQFLGYRVDDLEQKNCDLKSITFLEVYDSTRRQNRRDIFSLDDIVYVAGAANTLLTVDNTPEDADRDGRPDWLDGDANGNGLPD